jgi:hypothetical protein
VVLGASIDECASPSGAVCHASLRRVGIALAVVRSMACVETLGADMQASLSSLQRALIEQLRGHESAGSVQRLGAQLLAVRTQLHECVSSQSAEAPLVRMERVLGEARAC